MSRRQALPICLYISGRTVLVVGDGDGAEERAQRLRASGATVTRVARADYLPEQLVGAFLVVANHSSAAEDGSTDADGSTDNGADAFNRQVATDARAAGCLAYAHDQPELSDLAMPALLRRGPLAIAISTDGTAPALSRRLREELQSLLHGAGTALDHLVAHLAAQREALPRGAERAALLYRIASRLSIRGSLLVRDASEEAGDDRETPSDV